LTLADEITDTNQPVTQCHIPEEQRLQTAIFMLCQTETANSHFHAMLNRDCKQPFSCYVKQRPQTAIFMLF